MSKKATRAAKQEQGYERSPPRCGNCAQYVTLRLGRPPKGEDPGLPFIPPTCSIGQFAVDNTGICDRWTGKDGAALETEPPCRPEPPFTFAAMGR